MPSERIQRRTDALLDEADQATSQQQWERVAGAARAVLAIDEANEDAQAFLKMAGANDVAAPTPPSPPPESAAAIATAQPKSFVDERYQVKRFLGEGGKKRVFLAHDS